MKDVLHTRVMLSADCYTDRRLVRATVRLIIKPAVWRGEAHKSRHSKWTVFLSWRSFKTNLRASLPHWSNRDRTREDVERHERHFTKDNSRGSCVLIKEKRLVPWKWRRDATTDLDKRSCHQRVMSNPDNQAAKSNYKQVCSTLQKKLR